MAGGLLLGGCSSCEMKGTPFYTGEYKVNVPGAETRRVNLWPITYSSEPELAAWTLTCSSYRSAARAETLAIYRWAFIR